MALWGSLSPELFPLHFLWARLQPPKGGFKGGAAKRPPAATSKSLQACPTLSDPMDCSLPGSSVHGIFQARVLEWAAIAFSKKARLKGPEKLPKIVKLPT